mgnify:CR=1 FL=1
MRRVETVDKHYHLDKDVADWIDSQPGNKSKLVSDIIREAGMGSGYRRKQLEAIIAEDGPGALAAMAELDELEKHKETKEYRLRFLEDQKRVIRSYTVNGGFVSNIVRESIQNNLDMDKIEVIEFINSTILDYEKGNISNLDIDLEIKELKAQRTEEPESLFEEPVIDELKEYCPY